MTAGTKTCASSASAVPAAGSSSLPGAILLLSKPGIVLAETAAGLTGMLLASRGQPPSGTIVCWCLLSLIMAASGAAMVNCFLEADTDRKMARLADRNLALATVGRTRVLAIALSLLGGAFLVTGIYLNLLTLLLLTATCGSYLLLYTFSMKQRSPWSVLAGAVPGALPPLIGAAAVAGTVSALPLLLGFVIVLWQFPHFWFLALQYSDQYCQAGIPVLPFTHGIKLTKGLTLLSSAALLPATLAFSLLGPVSPGFTSAILLTGILFPLFCHHFLYRTYDYRKGFMLSLAYLATILVALIADIILR